MMDVPDVLGRMGYRAIEPIPARPGWFSLTDQQHRPGRVWVVSRPGDVATSALPAVDAILVEVPLDFAIVVIAASLSADQAEALTTWNFPCQVSITTMAELTAAIADDEEVAAAPAETATSLLPQEGERVLDVLGRLRSRLLDLTLRNPLLNYRSGSSRTVPIVDELPRQVMKQLFKGQSLTLEAQPDAGEADDRESPPLPRRRRGRLTVHSEGKPPEAPAATVQPGEPSAAVAPDPLDEPPDFSLPNDPGSGRLADRWCDTALQTPLAGEPLGIRLRTIFRDQNLTIASTGTNTLHLAVGLLHWYESVDESKARLAPLLLVPVTLDRQEVTVTIPLRRGDAGWDPEGPALQSATVREFRYAIAHGGMEVLANLSLIRKMEQDFALGLPDIPNDLDASDLDPEAYFRSVAAVIARHPTDRRWKVRREIALGFFSFTKHLEWLDLDPANWTEDPQGLLERIMTATEGEPRPSDPVDVVAERLFSDLGVPLFLEADSSQAAVLSRGLAGEDLVVQGPPGTGKSQTIANLIAAATCAGKRVLFVAEKLAALAAVREKFAAKGLAEHCLELHSHRASPTSAIDALRRRLAKGEAAAARPRSNHEELHPLRSTLNNHAQHLGTLVDGYQEPVHTIFWRADEARLRLERYLRSGAPAPLLEAPAGQTIPIGTYREAVPVLKAIAQLLLDDIPQRARSWSGFRCSRFLGDEATDLLRLIEQLVDIVHPIAGTADRQGAKPWWSEAMHRWPDLLNALATVPPVPGGFIQAVATLSVGSQRTILTSAVSQLQDLRSRRLAAAAITSQIPEEGDYRSQAKALTYLCSQGCGELGIDKCRTILTSLDHLREVIQRAQSAGSAVLGEFHLAGEVTWQRLPLLQKLLLFLRHPDHKGLLHPRLLRGTSRAAIFQGASTHEDLIGERNRLQQVLVLEDCPSDADIRDLRQTLRVRPKAFLAFFGLGPLAQARKRMRRFVRSEKILSVAEYPVALDRVISWRGKVATFAQDRTLAAEIPGFAGIETRWPAVQASVTLLAELSAAFGQDGIRTCCEIVLRETYSPVVAEESEAPLAQVLDPGFRQGFAWQALGPQLATAPLMQTLTVLDLVITEMRTVTEFYGRLTGLALAGATVAEVSAAIGTVTGLQDLSRSIATNASISRLLGSAWHGERTDLDPIVGSLAWADHIHTHSAAFQAAGPWLVAQDSECRAAEGRAFATGARAAWTRALAQAERLSAWGSGAPGSPFDPRSCTLTYGDLLAAWTAALAAGDHLIGWSRWCVHAEQGRALGLMPVILAGERGDVSPQGLLAALEADIYGRLARSCLASFPELQRFERAAFDTTRQDFRTCDRDMLRSGRDAIAQQLLRLPIPRGQAGTRVGDLTEMRLVEHEVSKQRAHIPVRRLLERSWNAVTGLTPCLMMSPLSVAQLLPRTRGLFDLVVMDEASQIRPEDAFGALLRGKQAIIVGDTKQMPPSRLFDSALGVTDAADGALAGSSLSILELAETSFGHGRARLTWHYRSQHESLIQFSNARYYDNELIIFPSHRMPGPHLGIQRVYLPEGRFQGGTNPVEALAVAEAVLTHAVEMISRPADKRESLLVVTMNREQCDLVTNLLEKRGSVDEEVRTALQGLEDLPEPLLIKNLENVQGDERDRVIIGFTYGADPVSGRVFNRFGPIGQTGGERRLNVLFSRAKRSITVFTSMQSGDILIGHSSARGPRDLKDYLQFLETGAIPERGVLTRREPDSPFELSVGAVVADMGLSPAYQVGVAGYFIDIGVIDPRNAGHYLLGIECDGASYHSSRCARDRDRLRQDIIESRGWTIHRIWSTAWFRDRSSEVKRLQRTIQAAQARRA